MEDNAGFYLVENGVVIREASVPVQVGSASGRAAYEVLRIINGVPLFYQDHYDRMEGTFRTIGKPLEITAEQLKKDIKELLAANKTDNCNVKVIVSNEEGRQKHLVYISKSYYPSEKEINAGVKTGVFEIERSNPNAKLINQSYKDAVTKKIHEGDYFEVLLVDKHGRITEGSKSNAFFVKGGNIYTAPGEFVLKGITRKYVFEACRSAGFEVIEGFVGADDLSQISAAFLSGTSIKVLPIRTIDNIFLDSSADPLVTAVRQEYDKLIEKYVDKAV